MRRDGRSWLLTAVTSQLVKHAGETVKNEQRPRIGKFEEDLGFLRAGLRIHTEHLHEEMVLYPLRKVERNGSTAFFFSV